MADQNSQGINWSIPQRCLLLGVAGTGMRGLAEILHQAGHTVYGSDIVYSIGNHTADHIAAEPSLPNVQLVSWDAGLPPQSIDVCICSPAIPDTVPLHRWVSRQSIPVMSLHSALAALFANRSQICVTGTHGKSTTASVLAWLLNQNNRDAGVFVGASLNSSIAGTANQGAHFGHGHLAVIEACEFGRSFLNLKPHHVIINGIDGDHFDCFEDIAAEDTAYSDFLKLLPSDGVAFVNAACSRSVSAAARTKTSTVQWALDNRSAAGWNGEIVDDDTDHMTVRIRHAGRSFGDVKCRLFGRHNAENVLAAVAMSSFLGMSAVDCQRALVEFPGVQRRLDFRGDYGRMRMLDDYAHHPTAVTTTLQAVRRKYPDWRIRVIFEPHQVNRLQRCENEFVRALSAADEVIVFPVFPAREQVSEACCHRISRRLAATICDQGIPAVFADGVNSVVSIVEHTGQPQDLFLTLGAGIVHRIHDEVHRRFQRNSAA